MKSIKHLTLLVSFLLSLTTYGQSYHDSLRVTGVHTIPSLSDGISYFVRYYQDSVTFDSISGSDEFYTVRKKIVGMAANQTIYHFRVNDHKVYMSGSIQYSQTIVLKDKLIYDYNMALGDTLTVKLNTDTMLDIKFRLDSAKMMMYLDGVKRITYFYTMWKGGGRYPDPVFSAEGVGSSLGLMYIRTDNIPLIKNQLISVCAPSSMIYSNQDCMVGYYKVKPFCDDDSISSEIAKAVRADINTISVTTSVNAYPNPANDALTINANRDGFVSVLDMTGNMCISKAAIRAGSTILDVSGLNAGIYLMAIEANNTTVFKKLIITHSY